MNKCSRAGCLEDVKFLMKWRNPKLHDETREKVWGSCKDHREYFFEYLTVRGFYLGQEAIH